MDGRSAPLLHSFYAGICYFFLSVKVYSYCSSENAAFCFCLQISSVEIFIIGAIAKAIATTATYPLQTVQAILRVNTLAVCFTSIRCGHIMSND